MMQGGREVCDGWQAGGMVTKAGREKNNNGEQTIRRVMRCDEHGKEAAVQGGTQTCPFHLV